MSPSSEHSDAPQTTSAIEAACCASEGKLVTAQQRWEPLPERFSWNWKRPVASDEVLTAGTVMSGASFIGLCIWMSSGAAEDIPGRYLDWFGQSTTHVLLGTAAQLLLAPALFAVVLTASVATSYLLFARVPSVIANLWRWRKLRRRTPGPLLEAFLARPHKLDESEGYLAWPEIDDASGCSCLRLLHIQRGNKYLSARTHRTEWFAEDEPAHQIAQRTADLMLVAMQHETHMYLATQSRAAQRERAEIEAQAAQSADRADRQLADERAAEQAFKHRQVIDVARHVLARASR